MSRLAGFRDVCAAGVFLTVATTLDRNAHASESKLLVFLHVPIKQRAFQSELQGALPGIDITAVGRIGDFERTLKDGTDVVIALPPLLAAFKLEPRLRGCRGGSTEEKYSLVSVGAVPNPARVGAVGALDLLGRERTNEFVHGLLGRGAHVERVTKVEDLLPLLQMQRVDAILLPSRMLPEIKATSRLSLFQYELDKKVGLPAAASLTPAGAQVLTALGKMPGNVMKTLGVDSWR